MPKILSSHNAGILIEQKDFSLKLLEKTLLDIDDTQIQQMSDYAKQLAKPEAAKMISDYLLEIG